MQTIWDISAPKEEQSSAAEDGLLFSPLTSKLLSLRALATPEAVNRFLFPKLENLHDPFLMKGIREASRRILVAAERKELILIHGDYDADGITGTALLAKTLDKLGARYLSFLPDRFRDGYGVSAGAIELAKTKGVSLIVTIDCGIGAFEEVARANESKIDVIIVDHHQIEDKNVPAAFAVINPLQPGCEYPFKELSACGLAFKLCQALTGHFVYSLLDLAALSTVCDIAPIVDENRILVKYGLDLISERKNLGLAKLAAVGKLKSRKANVGHLGFVLGPRINASGRMSSAETALRLLVTNQEKEAESLARILDEENKARQRQEREVLKQAINQVERKVQFNRERVIVVWQEGWHQGVIGIVAQRLAERYGRPSFVIGLEGGTGKGSARSVRGFHLFRALEHCHEELIEFGGHELAAGFSISASRLDQFRERVNAYAAEMPVETFVRRFRVDLEVPFEELTPAFFRELELFEPFGVGNPRPVFLTRGVRSKMPAIQTSPTSLKWWVTDGVSTFEANWTQRQGIEKMPPDAGISYDLVYAPSLKERDGIETVHLDVKDLKPAS